MKHLLLMSHFFFFFGFRVVSSSEFWSAMSLFSTRLAWSPSWSDQSQHHQMDQSNENCTSPNIRLCYAILCFESHRLSQLSSAFSLSVAGFQEVRALNAFGSPIVSDWPGLPSRSRHLLKWKNHYITYRLYAPSTGNSHLIILKGQFVKFKNAFRPESTQKYHFKNTSIVILLAFSFLASVYIFSGPEIISALRSLSALHLFP